MPALHVAGAFGRTQPPYRPKPFLPIEPERERVKASPLLGIEFVARARNFRTEVRYADREAVAAGERFLDLALATRQQRKSTLERRRHDRWIVREWPKQVTGFGRLHFMGDVIHGKGVRLIDTRLVATSHRGAHWQFEEESVSISSVVLRANTQTAKLQILPLACIGIHALSRFFARSFDNSEERLIEALIVLQHASSALLDRPQGASFVCPAGDGAWRGERIAIPTECGDELPLLRVSTFYERNSL